MISNTLQSFQSANERTSRDSQRGTATLTSVLILALLALFTAATLSRVSNEATVMGNDYTSTKSFYAAQASLEQMSRNFQKIFDRQLRPTASDLKRVKDTKPTIDGFTFTQDITANGVADTKPIDDGDFAGMLALRTPYKLDAVATYSNGAQVQLTRTFYNNQIPLFQFGVFYNDDMEFHPGPRFDFGGRVHSNGNLFMMAGSDLYFRSKVTAVGAIVRDVSKSGLRGGSPIGTGSDAGWSWNGNVWVADAAGNFQAVTKGSVIGAGQTGLNAAAPGEPPWIKNTSWDSLDSKPFNGNLLANRNQIKLPLEIISKADAVELIRRGRDANDYEVTGLGRAADDDTVRGSRYCNQPGIRVTLADAQKELPGGTGGRRLDGDSQGLTGGVGAPGAGNMNTDGSRGYWPIQMTDGYRAKRVNGFRLYTGDSYLNNGVVGTTMPSKREHWIKVENVKVDTNTGAITTTDITEDILSLGLTHKDTARLNIGDDRAMIKMQRYEIAGPPIKVAASDMTTNTANPTPWYTSLADARAAGTFLPAYSYDSGAASPFSIVALRRSTDNKASWTNSNATTAVINAYDTTANAERTAHGVQVNLNQTVVTGSATTSGGANSTTTTIAASANNWFEVVPVPIEIFNTREGLFSEDLPDLGAATATSTSWSALYTGGGAAWGTTPKIPYAGVVSLIDIDMNNLGKLVTGVWDGKFPNGLKSTDFQDNGGAGYIIYVSDRRGDRDFDGEYDMEDIYINGNGTQNNTLEVGEDSNHNGTLQTDFDNAATNNNHGEAARYNQAVESDVAATQDHYYFRRGVRVINGATLAGTINKGYSIATENGIYVLGNLNTTGITASTTNPTPPANYNGAEVPLSIVADAITVLSNNWLDGKSFRNPFRVGTRTGVDTAVRAAFLMGDSISSLKIAGSPSSGGGDAFLAGGVHNFPRFLESWGSKLSYCGSLINLYNARQHNGGHKNGSDTYSPPTRDWTFDTSFLDMTRLPPGTPFFQFVQMTGFRQTIRQLT